MTVRRCTLACLSALLSFALLSALSSTGLAQEHQHATPPSPRLDQIKKLVGEWVAVGEDGKPTDQVVSVYRETAGGSAVQETLFPGQDMEMVTVYFQSGDDLRLTHYCMLGNQPEMKAAASSDDKHILFEFAGGANIKPETDAHMHQGLVKFLDENTLETEWTAWENGKPGEVVTFKLVRKPAQGAADRAR